VTVSGVDAEAALLTRTRLAGWLGDRERHCRASEHASSLCLSL